MFGRIIMVLGGLALSLFTRGVLDGIGDAGAPAAFAGARPLGAGGGSPFVPRVPTGMGTLGGGDPLAGRTAANQFLDFQTGRIAGYHYCGAGNDGQAPVNPIDSFCELHDQAYDSLGASFASAPTIETWRADQDLIQSVRNYLDSGRATAEEQKAGNFVIGAMMLKNAPLLAKLAVGEPLRNMVAAKFGPVV